MACHERHKNGQRSIKGLLLGAIVSWVAVSVWTIGFKGNPVAMGLAMGIIVLILVLATKWRFLGGYQFIAMPQAFLGATIYFGLFNTFMVAKGAAPGLLFGWLQPLALTGAAQPHIAGVLAILSAVVGVLLGLVHQHISLRLAGARPSYDG